MSPPDTCFSLIEVPNRLVHLSFLTVSKVRLSLVQFCLILGPFSSVLPSLKDRGSSLSEQACKSLHFAVVVPFFSSIDSALLFSIVCSVLELDLLLAKVDNWGCLIAGSLKQSHIQSFCLLPWLFERVQRLCQRFLIAFLTLVHRVDFPCSMGSFLGS